MDRYYDLHPRSCWSRGGKKGATYPAWLAKQTTPIYMQHRTPEVPASVEYPKRRMLMEFSYAHKRHYFSNHAAWMIAHAILEGVTTIGLFGINYALESEYIRQRGSVEYWLGQLDGRGVNVVLPEQCSLLRDPALLYGYDSHDETTGRLKPEYAQKVWPQGPDTKAGTPGVQKAIPTPDIQAEIDREEIEYPRPAWALGPQRTDGGIRGEA
jgi:hypothetical protein